MQALPRLFFLLLTVYLATSAYAQVTALPDTTLPLETLDAFQSDTHDWHIVGDVSARLPGGNEAQPPIDGSPGTGVLLHTSDTPTSLFTDWQHGDLEVEMAFMLPMGASAGIALQSRYYIPLNADSWRARPPRADDTGGIYHARTTHQLESNTSMRGIPPQQNAARAPGLWQHLRIVFQAPRFDAQGQKVANARFVEVVLNGVPIHENVQVTDPTQSAAYEDEQPTGPLMFHGGSVAFRTIRYKRYNAARVQLADVRHRYYPGSFERLPDLAMLTPELDETRDGLYWNLGADPSHYTLHTDGTLLVPATGTYQFHLDFEWLTGDPHFRDAIVAGGVLTIDGQPVLTHAGIARVASGQVDLHEGAHTFSLTYFKNRSWNDAGITLMAEGPAMPVHVLNAPETVVPQPSIAGAIYVEPGAEPVLLRSMVPFGGGKRTHAISVGDPTGVHYSLDLDKAALLYVWRGAFADATPMWHDRGTDQLALPRGSMLPLSGNVPFIFSDDPPASPPPAPPDVHLKGYTLNAQQRPTFHYQVGAITVDDQLTPDASLPILHRSLTFQADTPSPLWYRVAEGDRITLLPDGLFIIDDTTYYIAFDLPEGIEPIIHTEDERQTLLVPIRFTDGQAALSYTLTW